MATVEEWATTIRVVTEQEVRALDRAKTIAREAPFADADDRVHMGYAFHARYKFYERWFELRQLLWRTVEQEDLWSEVTALIYPGPVDGDAQ